MHRTASTYFSRRGARGEEVVAVGAAESHGGSVTLVLSPGEFPGVSLAGAPVGGMCPGCGWRGGRVGVRGAGSTASSGGRSCGVRGAVVLRGRGGMY